MATFTFTIAPAKMPLAVAGLSRSLSCGATALEVRDALCSMIKQMIRNGLIEIQEDQALAAVEEVEVS